MSDFYSLAHAAQENPDSTDFAALRLAYVQSSHYRPFKHIPQTKLLQMTNNAADFAEVSRTCQTLLEANPMDLEARLLLGIAQEKAGQTAQAEKTKRFAEKMLDSILATGDGKSLASPLQVIAEAEVWTVMRSFGIRTTSHTRQQTDSQTYDIFSGRIGEREVTIYFDVTPLMTAFDQDIVGQESASETP